MRCAYAEPRLRALADGELEPGESRKVFLHLERCAACREQFARTQAMVSLFQEQELEEPPAHLSASIQVRLSRHRRERAPARFRLPALPRLRLSPRPWRWVGGLTTAALAAGLCVSFLSPRIGAAEVARRAEHSWLQIRNYGCEFVSSGVYQGQERVFRQKQFYRRPGEFRLDTAQDYPLTTFVYHDRVVHYLPGGDWEGRGPLVIVRPRRSSQNALPFPFGVTWQNGGNVSLDQLIRQLSENPDAELVGTERVGEADCYRLRFAAVPPGGRQKDQYELWIDKRSFLPRRVHWYRDENNRVETEARELQVNNDLLPEGTFDFQVPKGAVVIHGDVDPHVLALPFLPARQESYDSDPVGSARFEAWRRAQSVPFPVLSPRWLPDGFRLVRVRRKQGRWVDTHWLRVGPAGERQVLKLVQQDAAGSGEEFVGAEEVDLGTRRLPIPGRMLTRYQPYSHSYVTWDQGPTRCTLFAAGLEVAEIRSIVQSMAEVTLPAARVVVEPRPRFRVEDRGEASALPEETAELLTPHAPASAGEEPSFFEPAPPMMPEPADDDRMAFPAAGR
jgi:outer membrane lipoprotein-sorting protein